MRCKRCKNSNHSERNCLYEPKEEVKLTEIDSDSFLLTCSLSLCQHSLYTRVVDNGCSRHMAKDRIFLTTLDENYKSTVFLGDGKEKIIEGRGTSSVNSPDGEPRYVPTLTQNLLIASQLLGRGFKIIFEEGLCSIKHPQSNTTIITTHMNESNLFTLCLPPATSSVLSC